MFRPYSPIVPEKKDVNCILMNGGIGDHVGGSLVAIDYILKTYPWINLLIWAPDFLVDFAKNVLPNANIRSFTSMALEYDPNITTVTTRWDGRHSAMKTHVVDYAFHVLCDETPGVDQRNSLKVNLGSIDIGKFNLPDKYVVFATGHTAEVRQFSPPIVNTLITYVKSKGYKPVFLGQTSTSTGGKHVIKGNFNSQVKYDKGLNLVDKTNLLEAAKIMSGAKVMLGVDCGLMHVAACTDVPIVGGYTTVTPELRMPTRNGIEGYKWYSVVPDENLGCRFCQVKTNFLYGHDYTKCLYKDNLCVSQLRAEKFIAHLEKIL